MDYDIENPSLDDVKKYLKDAGSFDPTLNEMEMFELFQVLQNSQSTATEEDEQRRIFEQTEANCSMIEELRKDSVFVNPEDENLAIEDDEATENDDSVLSNNVISEENEKRSKKEKPFTPRTWSQQKKQLKPLADIEDQISSTSIRTKHSQQTQEKEEENFDVVDVFDCVPTTHKPLTQISVSPKYSPPYYCNPKITKGDYKHRALLISNYHLELLHKYDNYQRQSVFPAPWGKPVQTNMRFNGNLMRKIDKFEENVESSQGSDVADQLSELLKEDKNSDDDFEFYVSKSGRQTKRKLYNESSGRDNNDTEWKKRSKPTPSDEDAKKSYAKKRRGLGPLSNEEIKKRSKLFDDDYNNSTRQEKMFDKLRADANKKKEAEKEMQKFTETLDHISGEEDVEDVAELVHSDEPFIRRRIVPPSFSKKPVGAGKNKPSGRGNPGGKRNAVNKKSSQDSLQESGSQKYDSLEISMSTVSSSSKKKEECPVCFQKFFKFELVKHTPACLDSHNENSVSTNAKPSEFCEKRITCEICDAAFTLNLDYEVHVKQCMDRYGNK